MAGNSSELRVTDTASAVTSTVRHHGRVRRFSPTLWDCLLTGRLNAATEDISIQPGESVQIVREADAAECGVTLFIDDERVYGERIDGHASVTVTVGSNGEIDEEEVML